jgi:two-component system phosphate regulon response regulator PhoB
MDRRHPRNPPLRPLVLIVERHDDTRALYALSLSAMGFDVIPARDRTEASRRAWESHPDIIVTDLPTPNDDGSQFLRDLRENPRTRDIPVVGLSGRVQRSREERAEREGLAAFFPSPCLPDELAAVLRQVLNGQAHAQREPAFGSERKPA